MVQHEKDRLLSIQGSAKRMYSTPDGEIQLKFIEHMAGITDFVHSASLEKVEGLKRYYVLLNKMINSKPDVWLKWYEEKGRNIYSV